MAETVELATIWLVDLVGSTRLATAVGPVRADSLRDEYFALLRDAIDASGGREFKNTGDGLFVAFSSASAAVSCAVLTQQLFERRYRGAEQALHVRIGLGTGESTVKDGDYFGMPSIEAARLCDKAPADGILVSPATKMLAGRVEGARFESVGEMELKGIPEPMEAFAVAWEPLADESGVQVGAWPVPPALRSVPRAPYVGRADERALMERSRAQARAGARQVVLLAGEPGIGKTRLASHAALRAHAEGFAVCWGACSEDVAAPYEPWIEVCSQLVEHAPDDVLAGYVASRGGEIARLARNLARRAPDAPLPQSVRSRDRALPPVQSGRRAAARGGALAAAVRGARRLPLGRRAVGRAAQARGPRGRAGRAAGDRHLSRLGSDQGSPADRGARGSAAERGRGADPSERARTGRGCRAGGGRGGPRARCRRSGARGWTRDRDRGQPVLRRRDPAQPDRVRGDHVRRDDASLERRPGGDEQPAGERPRGRRAPDRPARRGGPGGADESRR